VTIKIAKVDESNLVTDLIVLPKSKLETYQIFIAEKLGLSGSWILSGEENEAFIGGYLLENGNFTVPKPFLSWVYHEETKSFVAPVPTPEGNTPYSWNEPGQSWTKNEGAK
tara:strand:- start:225 stop:557 length:333 start_codon:yes stop_codon:yes gene_type:complete